MAKYKLERTIKRKGYPTSSKTYAEGHEEASTAEKRKYPKGYAKLKRQDKVTPASELLGTHTRSGRIKVSRKVPKSERAEVAFHEEVETKAMNRLSRKRK